MGATGSSSRARTRKRPFDSTVCGSSKTRRWKRSSTLSSMGSTVSIFNGRWVRSPTGPRRTHRSSGPWSSPRRSRRGKGRTGRVPASPRSTATRPVGSRWTLSSRTKTPTTIQLLNPDRRRGRITPTPAWEDRFVPETSGRRRSRQARTPLKTSSRRRRRRPATTTRQPPWRGRGRRRSPRRKRQGWSGSRGSASGWRVRRSSDGTCLHLNRWTRCPRRRPECQSRRPTRSFPSQRRFLKLSGRRFWSVSSRRTTPGACTSCIRWVKRYYRTCSSSPSIRPPSRTTTCG